MTSKNSTKNKTILYRRGKIAGLWAEGISQQQDIADALKVRYSIEVTQMTVGRDLKALQAEWKEERVAETSEAITAALRRREHLFTLALADYERSKEPKKTTIQETIDSVSKEAGAKPDTRTKAQIKTEERNGDPRYLTVASQQAAAIEKIIGVYAPEKRDITSAGQAIKGYAIVSPDDWPEPTPAA